MKSRILTLIAITLFAALAIPARLAAQEHIRYKVDQCQRADRWVLTKR